jgi:hypothetical protein
MMSISAPCLEHEVSLAHLFVGPIQPDRTPEIRSELRESRRHDPDERSRHAVQHEALTEDARIAIELPQPHLVGHHEHGGGFWVGVLLREAAPKHGPDA